MIDYFPSQADLSSSDDESSSAAASALADDEIVDAFPSKIFDASELYDVQQLMDHATSMEYMKLSKAFVIPVIPFKKEYSDDEDSNRVYMRVVFYNLIADRNLLSDRFDRLYDCACIRLPRTGYEDVDWSAIDNKLMKNPRLTHRSFRPKTNKTDGLNRKGNADNRQSFVHLNQHLVKTYVTNGVRTTHVYDLYILYNVPILMYRQTSGAPLAEGSFYANTRNLFEAYLLSPTNSPYTIYAVLPDTTYLTISLQKSCYAIVRVTEEVLIELQKEYAILLAFHPNNIFRPKSQAELDKMTQINSCTKRKRGRHTKSLDKMYWYKDSSVPTTTCTATCTTMTISTSMHFDPCGVEESKPATLPATVDAKTKAESDEEAEGDSSKRARVEPLDFSSSSSETCTPQISWYEENDVPHVPLREVNDAFLNSLVSAEMSVQEVENVIEKLETKQRFANELSRNKMDSFLDEFFKTDIQWCQTYPSTTE